MTIRVVVADDQGMVRSGFSVLLNAQPGIEVTGEARNGQEAIDRAADAIVLATSNRIDRGVLTQGETVPYVFKNAPCNVLVVRARPEGDRQQ